MFIDHLISCVNAGLTLTEGLKVNHDRFCGTVELHKFYDEYVVQAMHLPAYKTTNLADAANFFGTLAFHQRNLCHFYSAVEKFKIGNIEDPEDLEDASPEEIDILFKEYCDKYFDQHVPLSKEFKHPKAEKWLKNLVESIEIEQSENYNC